MSVFELFAITRAINSIQNENAFRIARAHLCALSLRFPKHDICVDFGNAFMMTLALALRAGIAARSRGFEVSVFHPA